jgi:hypothetical protein
MGSVILRLMRICHGARIKRADAAIFFLSPIPVDVSPWPDRTPLPPRKKAETREDKGREPGGAWGFLRLGEEHDSENPGPEGILMPSLCSR